LDYPIATILVFCGFTLYLGRKGDGAFDAAPLRQAVGTALDNWVFPVKLITADATSSCALCSWQVDGSRSLVQAFDRAGPEYETCRWTYESGLFSSYSCEFDVVRTRSNQTTGHHKMVSGINILSCPSIFCKNCK